MRQPRTASYPVIPLPYNTVLLPNRTLHISPVNRADVIAVIAKVYSSTVRTKTKENAYLIGCVPLNSPYLSPDGQRLIEDANPEDGGKPASTSTSTATKDDLFHYGTLAKVVGIHGRQTGELTLVVEGVSRMKVDTVSQEKPYFEVQATTYKDHVDENDAGVQAAFSQLKQTSRELLSLVRLSSLVPRGQTSFSPILARQLEVFIARRELPEAGMLADFMANLLTLSHEEKLRVLAAVSVPVRLERVIELLQKQITSLQGNTRILTLSNNGQNGIDVDRLVQMQRDSVSRRGSGNSSLPGGFSAGSNGGQPVDEESSELEELKKRLDEAQLSPEAQKVATRELKRLQKMNPAQAEYQVCRNYLENLAEVPWSNVTEDKLGADTLSRARKQLDDDHYGLEKIKKRLLEYLAVLKLKQSANNQLEEQIRTITAKVSEREKQQAKSTDSAPIAQDIESDAAELRILHSKRMIDKSPILLLVGPPGTGKTSLAKSVAAALGRKFHRISLGGVRDEAEIRGHRRTYVAAMPGLIVSGLKKVGVANPVFLLDEIDKVGTSNFHGDPSAAMLEVLDPEQNHTFMDHYLNIPIDLSRVLFIATANSMDTIPPPLLDRMETISLSGYTTLEKRHIAMRHLLPKQIRTNALQPQDIQMDSEVIDKIITSYTRESGVRNLERELGSVCRFKAVEFADAQDKHTVTASTSEAASSQYSPVIKVEDLEEILGIERFDEEIAEKSSLRPGVVTGLVAYSMGGQGSILFIEVADMPGTGRVQLTGKLGDVLKESVEVALTWVKSHAFALGLTNDPSEDIMKNRSIHVHCPQGAVPKDGPSAGLAHTIALISLFGGKPVPPTIAMTGEVSLRGKVTPVGGIKEKLIGALRAGVKTVLLPEQNRKEVKELPKEVKEGLTIITVANIWQALCHVWPDAHWPDRWADESRL